ncbi:hypothetical protein LUZ60_002587 [Juncus effusus]|nr:hypothetical protein LUZ60_002587 [Juncus effusus]
MAVDFRQVVAGFLTLSMFVMLANMIKTDHFSSSSSELSSSSSTTTSFTDMKISESAGIVKVEQRSTSKITTISVGPKRDVVKRENVMVSEEKKIMKPCWSKPDSKDVEESKGYITLSLTSGPEYHISQITNAVVIAKYLGATLILPDIRGSELGHKRSFDDIYDVENFISTLNNIIKVKKEVPADVAGRQPTLIRVKNRISEDQIAKMILPTFRNNNYIRLAISFQSMSFKPKELYNDKYLLASSCVAMFEALKFQNELLQMGEIMIQRLRSLGSKQFVAVDLKVDCTDFLAKRCFGASEIAQFLKQLGYDSDTVVYLTETWWGESLNPLKEAFPKTYTKDDIIPAEKKGKFLKPGNQDLEKALDFHICSDSDIFVPAVSGFFYGQVSGRRIASGQTQIFVPAKSISDSWGPNSDFVSPFVSKKSHSVHYCYC